jgi:hypothetical protein
LGKNEIEDALKRLDTLTQEEARMATAEVWKVAQRMDNKMSTDGAYYAFSLATLAFLNTDWLDQEKGPSNLIRPTSSSIS